MSDIFGSIEKKDAFLIDDIDIFSFFLN